MDNEGNFHDQSEKVMMQAVWKGELSVRDFYEKKADIADSVRSVSRVACSKFRQF